MKTLSILLLIVVVSFTVLAQEEEATLSGRQAPNFKLENLDGDYVELNQFLGEGPVLLSFWATWCKPCLEELQEYQKIYDEFKDKGFKMLAISVDDVRTLAKVKPYIRSRGYTFPVLLDSNSDVARIYYAQAVPFSVLMDKNGVILYSHLGYTRGDELELKEKIEELLKQ